MIEAKELIHMLTPRPTHKEGIPADIVPAKGGLEDGAIGGGVEEVVICQLLATQPLQINNF